MDRGVRTLKVWMDVLTPKQILFLGPLADRLRQMGFKIYLTTRIYREIAPLANMKGLKMERIGRHGGPLLEEKLRCSCLRAATLSKRVREERVDLSVSFSSVEAARVAFGLSIPHICVSDSPHSEAVSKLTVPLSSFLYTPWIIPKKAWMCYGIDEDRIIHYRALDPAAWLKGFKPNPYLLRELNLSSQRPIVVFRPEEEQAAYIINRRGTSPIPEVVRTLLESDVEAELVIVPRYREQYVRYMRAFGKRVKVLRRAVDGAGLINVSKSFVGAGGTMTCEAALLGVPTLSCYPLEPTYVEQFLVKEKLIQRSLEPQRIVDHVMRALEDGDYAEIVREKANSILASMEDPVETLSMAVARHIHAA